MVVDWSEPAFPAVCVKCGKVLTPGSGETADERQLRHLRASHRVSIGTASAADRASFEFVYIGPVPGVTTPRWYVLTLEASVKIVVIEPEKWTIAWHYRNDRQLSQGDTVPI